MHWHVNEKNQQRASWVIRLETQRMTIPPKRSQLPPHFTVVRCNVEVAATWPSIFVRFACCALTFPVYVRFSAKSSACLLRRKPHWVHRDLPPGKCYRIAAFVFLLGLGKLRTCQDSGLWTRSTLQESPSLCKQCFSFCCAAASFDPNLCTGMDWAVASAQKSCYKAFWAIDTTAWSIPVNRFVCVRARNRSGGMAE